MKARYRHLHKRVKLLAYKTYNAPLDRGMERGCMRCRKRSGQVMLEYVMAMGILLSCVAMLSIFLYTFRSYGDRILALAAGEYP